ncbi:MAG: sirohydrochlorin chelatase [Leptothrix ochracea]|uniref:sirohydrochlorin chelatase n=1 Tax=Leptothrix ochracea TaxID=735331 RepID=UPI0034E1EC8B
MHGILLFAHGARNPAWANPFHAIAAHMRRCAPAQPVTLAFLELMTPNLADAARELIDAGCQKITVVPLFLGAGGHILNDLPVLVSDLRALYPTIQIEATPAIGQTEAIIHALAETALTLVNTATQPQP